MLLQKLVEYSARIADMAPEGYNYKPVRYLIELDSTGKLRNSTLIDLATKEAKFGQAYCVPDNGRTAGVAPRLLADDARYTFGYINPGSNNSDDHHEAYMKLLEDCVEVTQDYTVNAVQNFLRNDPLGQLQLPEKFDGKGVIIFRVDGKFPTELPVIREFWWIRYAELAEVATCMVCNEKKKTLRVLPFMIKGIPGDKANGSALLAANKEAFWSYGLEQAQIALICPCCADRFTKSINALLQRRETSLIFRAKSKGEDETGIAFVFWTCF